LSRSKAISSNSVEQNAVFLVEFHAHRYRAAGDLDLDPVGDLTVYLPFREQGQFDPLFF